MKKSISMTEVGLALREVHLLPSVYQTDWFRISTEDGDYYVYAGDLPDLYIEKRPLTDLFEFRNEEWILYFAMDMVNAKMNPVKLFQGSRDSITFRTNICLESLEMLGEKVLRSIERIEKAIDELGLACEIVMRDNERKDTTELLNSLTDPSPDNPWIQRKTRS